jgi:hypothetical protein
LDADNVVVLSTDTMFDERPRAVPWYGLQLAVVAVVVVVVVVGVVFESMIVSVSMSMLRASFTSV